MVDAVGGAALGAGVAARDRMVAIAPDPHDPLSSDVRDEPAVRHADAAIGALGLDGLGGHDVLLSDSSHYAPVAPACEWTVRATATAGSTAPGVSRGRLRRAAGRESLPPRRGSAERKGISARPTWSVPPSSATSSSCGLDSSSRAPEADEVRVRARRRERMDRERAGLRA